VGLVVKKVYIPLFSPRKPNLVKGIYKFRFVPGLFDPENLKILKIQFQ